MKNKKHFQKWMLSAAALLMVAPLASQSKQVHASEFTKTFRPGMINTYGIAPYADPKMHKKGGYTGTSGSAIGIDLNSKHSRYGNVQGTANANYVHDKLLSGFLVRNKKGIHGQPFGPTSSKFKVSMEGDKGHQIPWVVYMKPNPSEAGKVGMYYKDALLYYPNSKKGSKPAKPITLDARLFWNGSYRPNGVGANNSLHFSTRNISIKEPYQGAANFTLKLYHHGSKRQFKAIKTQITQTDIDFKQGLIFDPPQYLIYDKSTALNAGYTAGTGGITWGTHVAGKTTVFGDDGTHHGKQGTVLPEQKEGQITYVPKGATSSFNVTFVHSYQTVPWNYQNHRFASPSGTSNGYDVKKLQKLPSNYDTKYYYHTTQQVSGGQADYFGFDFDNGIHVGTYKITADKLVGTKKNHFKTTKQSKPLNVKDNQTIYFDIHTQLKGPSSGLVPKKNTDTNFNALPVKAAIKDKNDPNIGKAGLSDASKNKQRLVLRDYLDPSLELAGKPEIVYATKWNDKNLSGTKRDASKYFYVHNGKNSKGQTVVDAVLKPDAAKVKSNAWWKDYHLIIPVKAKKGTQSAHGNYTGGWTMIHNKAYLNEHGGDDGGGNAWVKIKFTHETVKDNGKPGVDSKKFVYGANLADPDKLGKLWY